MIVQILLSHGIFFIGSLEHDRLFSCDFLKISVPSALIYCLRMRWMDFFLMF